MPGELNWSESQASERTILIVDDESSLRSLLSRWLADDGWHCLSATNALQALDVLKQNCVQVVTSDMNMPGQNGLWLLEKINKLYPDISVLMLTAALDTQRAIEALTKGAGGYLLKPIQSQEYLFQVRQAWERGQLVRERREHLRTLERRVHEQTVALRMAQEETIHRLVMASACRDEETGAHIRRTGLFSEILALSVGWSAAEAEQLRMAAPMHDVGKIGIPDSILRKRGKLTEDEFEQMKQHTSIGARMLGGSNSPVLKLAEKVALSHHERWDGDGYPQRLSGEEIPEAARILSIVDVYDAISHNRVYRPAMSEEMVLEIMRRGLGTHFDPHLLTLFLTNYEQFREISLANPDETAYERLDGESLLQMDGELDLTEVHNS
jgi:putative two-component system response regulator